MSFNILPVQQPQTLAYALADSPVGLLAWNAQLFGGSLDDDFILANVAVYWFTGTAARRCGSTTRTRTPTRPRRPHDRADRPRHVRRRLPVGPPVRRARPREIVRWNSYDPGRPRPEGRDAGGHYAAHEATDLLVNDIREFFATLK